MRLTIRQALGALEGGEACDRPLFAHGTLSVEIYRPQDIDRQEPHAQDEVYVIASGSGYFVHGEEREAFGTGDVLFVAAGTAHRFEEFSDDFSTWVFFYGQEGGEHS